MVLFGFAALAIDLSYHRTLQLQAQNAADSAAYAGMVSLRESGDRTEAYNVAVEMLNPAYCRWLCARRRHRDRRVGTLTATASLTEATPNAISVAVKRDNLEASGGPIGFFGPALGYTLPKVTADAVSAIQPRDILFVMDQSTSMAGTMGYAVEGLVAALDVVVESDPNGLDQVGLVGFSEGSMVLTELQGAVDNYSTLRSDWEKRGLHLRRGLVGLQTPTLLSQRFLAIPTQSPPSECG